ncbi:hypothetical protein [Oscillatoria sp. FACHB-1406]|uniref:hypothetical protein n=1 Tax=Oscillatoria sp. FACHB-1406 TaxID=2692846 RepID=UPI001687E2EE|nr:hypothetical protein [Oscillatoria sp. FACHB-1406]MBD2578938.1 hypothetical protein [Oscillatoria sp. FACHB-1406]
MKYSAPIAALIATVLLGGIAANCTATQPLFSQSFPRISTRANNLPKTMETAIIEDLRNRLGLPEEPAFRPVIKHREPATWEGCLPTPGAPGYGGNCQPITHSGWKVKLEVPGETQAKGEIWTYYASQTDGTFLFDGLDSLNATVKGAIAKRLNLAPENLQVTAAELTFGACQTKADCLPGHKLGWRVVDSYGRMFHLDLQGNEMKRGLEMQRSEAGLPIALKNAVLRDVADRDGVLTANLSVEGIKATAWNWCRGGQGEGPTPPEMGACPDFTQSGWQIKVRSGPMRYVYYLQEGSTAVAPDGMQSFPENAIARIKEDMAQRDPTTVENVSIRQVSPQFFNGCLNAKTSDLSCRQNVRAGWVVTAMGGGSLPNQSWHYNVDLFGDRIEFIRTGTWHPVP